MHISKAFCGPDSNQLTGVCHFLVVCLLAYPFSFFLLSCSVFEQCHVLHTQCAPSRAALTTGLFQCPESNRTYGFTINGSSCSTCHHLVLHSGKKNKKSHAHIYFLQSWLYEGKKKTTLLQSYIIHTKNHLSSLTLSLFLFGSLLFCSIFFFFFLGGHIHFPTIGAQAYARYARSHSDLLLQGNTFTLLVAVLRRNLCARTNPTCSSIF